MGTATDNISFGGADFLSLMLVLFVSILHTFSLVADLVFKSEILPMLFEIFAMKETFSGSFVLV